MGIAYKITRLFGIYPKMSNIATIFISLFYKGSELRKKAFLLNESGSRTGQNELDIETGPKIH